MIEFERLVALALSEVPPMLAADPAFVAAVRKALAMKLGMPAPRLH